MVLLAKINLPSILCAVKYSIVSFISLFFTISICSGNILKAGCYLVFAFSVISVQTCSWCKVRELKVNNLESLWEKQILLDRTDSISSMFFSNHYFGGSSASVDFFPLDDFFFIVLALESILCCLLYQWPENASKSVISTTMMIVLFPLQVYNSHHACTLFYWMLYLNINSHNHFCEKWLYSSLHVEVARDATVWGCVKMLDNVLRNRKKQPNNKKLHEYLC